MAQSFLPPLTKWWLVEANTPDQIKVNVFKAGKFHGLMALMPSGGHLQPISMLGDKAACAKAQKKLIKNINSDKTNK